MKLKKLIPFRLMPASWGLSGKSREIAEAEYYYTGVDLEKRLAEIHAESSESAELEKLNIELKHQLITQQQYNRNKADLLNEPYVEVVKIGLVDGKSDNGYVELDWNNKFIDMLHREGFKGMSDDEMVNKWFNQLCRTVLMQELNDQDYGLENVTDNPDRY